VGVRHLRADLVALARQPREPPAADLVERQDAVSHSPSAVAALEFLHESHQGLHPLERHRVVEARAHAADGAMALEVGEPGATGLALTVSSSRTMTIVRPAGPMFFCAPA